MKKQIAASKASRLINPGNLVLVSSSCKDKDNIVTCAWQAPCSHTPSCIMVALAKKHFSSQLIEKSEEFIINIPNVELLEKVIFCGLHSGRDCDKFHQAQLTREKPCVLVKTPKIKECMGNIECSLVDIKEIGDHFLFLGQPLYAEAEEDKFDFDNLVWKISTPLVFHLGGNFFAKLGKI